ncbi:BURP domain-containing protein 4 [Zea mays]|uniref:BURP domain-containing protein 4 n=1 Tax=Zea mays TaxID=4577 RepID=A0A3L6E3B4_MAIZE|nr:BURP domain-containing protein 4 [Zea mays]
MARGIILLLLVTPLAISMALPSLSTRIEGSVIGERSNLFSQLHSDNSSPTENKLQPGEKSFASEAYAVNWNEPPDQQSQDSLERPELYRVIWKQPVQGEKSFVSEAYPAKWNKPPSPSKQSQDSFEPEAYRVKWNKSPPPHQQSQDSFESEAYRVKWNKSPPHQQSQDSFEPEAYRVKWNKSPPPHQQSQDSFEQEAYRVKLNKSPPPHQQSQDSFEPEAYRVKWNKSPPPRQQSQDSFEQEAYRVKLNKSPPPQQQTQDSFEQEAYRVKWNKSPPPHQQSQDSFEPEAYRVKWNKSPPPHQQSQDSFEPEAYWVGWKKHAQGATDVADETTPARGHGLHVATGMLFTRKSLLPGTALPEGTKFCGHGFPDPERFELRADADAIPFSYSQLDTILRMFRIPRGSKKAEQVATTLRTCEAESPEAHACATSEQAAADFAASSLGVRASKLVALVTTVHGGKDATRYVVAPNGITRIGKAVGAAAVVPCHPMPYPYMVHYCHQPADVEALRVELTGLGDGGVTTAIAMCHANTMNWDDRYFQMLNVTRGEEICHFMPRNYVLWLPAAELLGN